MGLKDGTCDSCGDKLDVLFPIAILDELPSGGEAMVIKYYCLTCRESLEAEAESIEPKTELPPPPNNDKESCILCPDRAVCTVFGECREEHKEDVDLP